MSTPRSPGSRGASRAKTYAGISAVPRGAADAEGRAFGRTPSTRDPLEIGRFLVTAGDPGVVDHFLRTLFAPSGARGRWARLALRGLPGPLRTRAVVRHAAGAATVDPRREQLALIRAALARADVLLAGTPLVGWSSGRWIALRDYDRDSRMRVVLFLFPAVGDRPVAVLKIRPANRPGRSLESEWRALRTLAPLFDEPPAGSREGDARPRAAAGPPRFLPAALGYRVHAGIEALLLSALPGRSVDAELRTALRPAGRVAAHFSHAAAWLARFHASTRRSAAEPDLGAAPRARALRRLASLGSGAAAELARLQALAARRAGGMPIAAAHGDFWPRNVLLADGGVGVVDWERFAASAPCYVDLFRFPIAYGAAYARARGREEDPVETFRRTFLEDGVLARAVRDYLERYCEGTGLDPAALRPMLRLHLLTRESAGETHAGDHAEVDAWTACERVLRLRPRLPALPSCDRSS